MTGQSRELTSPEELRRIAQELYVYAYPLVLMEVTRRVTTNTERPQGVHAPMNQLAHLARFPDPSFTEVVRPNADTLYSSLWLDVSSEPLVIHVPDSGGRYYLLQMLDMWTDVFASPGARTSGTGEQVYAITGPGWHGQLPAGVEEIRCPTGMAWMIGRTQTNGSADYANVHKFQAGLTAAPLSRWGTSTEPPPGHAAPGQDMSAPPGQVAAMDARGFFALAAVLMGLGANVVDDAIYPTALTDASGQRLDSSRRYLLHFDPGQTPPVDAFWSLTMYDQRQLFTANPINRYAIGDRDTMMINADGSLDIHICRESPGAGRESNWLPAPASGPFSMNLRLYRPRPGALDGTWQPPPVRPQEG